MYFEQLTNVVHIPWQMAVGEDFRWAETQGPKAPGTDLINYYTARVHRVMAEDTVVAVQFLRVMNLLALPTSLFHPRLLWRILRPRFRNGRQEQETLLGAGQAGL
jgi:hypothetical protein